jgi:arsenate reductase (thioredoxin)
VTHLIEVLVSPGCPHAEATVTLVERIARSMIADASVTTTTVSDLAQAHELGFAGSPSVRIDGQDIEGEPPQKGGLACRIYPGAGGVPPEWMIETGLLRALRPRHILFMCVANSARSQLAEGIARSLAPPDVVVSSAGSEPRSVRPEAVEALWEIGIDISGYLSKGLDAIDTTTVEAVVTLCAEEVCPVFSGRAVRLHWGLPDPAGVAAGPERLSAFRSVRDELHKRLGLLFRRR